MNKAKTGSVRYFSAALLLALGLFGLGWGLLTRLAYAAPPTPPAHAPADWWSQVQRDIRLSEYQITWQEKTAIPGLAAAYQAPNRVTGFRTYFAETGLHIVPRGDAPKPGLRRFDAQAAELADSARWRLDITLVGVGDGQWVIGVDQPRLTAGGNRIEYQRGSLSEWYKNDETGLEQGFTLHAPPVSQGASPTVVIDLAFEGTLALSMAPGSDIIDLADGSGHPVLRYLGLKASDATGKSLPAHMALQPREPASPAQASDAHRYRVRLVVDATDARYPITVDPTLDGLSPAPNWSVVGGGGIAFGVSVARAGDINNDSYSDVIVGAPYFDNGEQNEGRAFVYLGSATGLATSAAWTAESNQADAYLGTSVATAGDVNHDGYADIIVGASDYDGSLTDDGAAFVWFGSAVGLGANGTPANADWSAFGGQASAYFGTSVGTAGDVDNDSYADIIVGALDYSNGQSREGRAYVYYGPDLTLFWTAEGDQADASFGASVGSAGDVNKDGYADVIIGAPNYVVSATSIGRVFVYYGSASGLGTAHWTADSELGLDPSGNPPNFGAAVSTAGDVNGDTYADVIISASEYDNTNLNAGKVYVYYGASGGLEASPAWMAEGDQPDAYFGSSIGTAGDVDGDGFADVVIGASGYDNLQGSVGRAFVYFGSNTGLATLADWWADGDQVDSGFGVSVGTAGDVNHDGYADVIVGASGEGSAYVYHGSGQTPPPIAPAVSIRRSGADLGLLWTYNPANAGGYDIWWSTNPYFTPGAADTYSTTVPAPTSVYTQTGVLGDVLHNYSYIVRGINADDVRSGDSNRVGEFEFTILPGNP